MLYLAILSLQIDPARLRLYKAGTFSEAFQVDPGERDFAADPFLPPATVTAYLSQPVHEAFQLAGHRCQMRKSTMGRPTAKWGSVHDQS